MYPASPGLCGDALIKCRMLEPVQMKETICNADLLPSIGFEKEQCIGCVSYQSGTCTLDNTKWEAFMQKSNAESLKIDKALYSQSFRPHRQGSY